jgi:hypothetical protein
MVTIWWQFGGLGDDLVPLVALSSCRRQFDTIGGNLVPLFDNFVPLFGDFVALFGDFVPLSGLGIACAFAIRSRASANAVGASAIADGGCAQPCICDRSGASAC